MSLFTFKIHKIKYEGRLKRSWPGGNAPLLCRARRWWLLC